MKIKKINDFRISCRLSSDNYKFLEEQKEATSATTTDLLNVIIAHFREEKKEVITSKKREDEKHKISFLVTDNEFYFLQLEAQKRGLKYARQEAKFRVLNSIHENKFFYPLEIEPIRETKKELNAIGRNLNAQVKTLQNRKAEIKNFDVQKYNIFLENISKKIDNLSDELANVVTQNKRRFQ